uniref:Secreted protein n=1 Tax=Anopheles triannulatus TaxID=58253 RepID=A0A2M4AJM7_9DIPT
MIVRLLLLLLMMLMMMVGHIGGRCTGWMHHRLRLLLTGDVALLLLRLLRLLLLVLLLLVKMVVMLLMVLMNLSRLYRGSPRWCDGEAAVHRRWRWRSLDHRRCSSTNPQTILAVALAIRLPNVIRSARSMQLMIPIERVRYGTGLIRVSDR